jgi:acetyltransferase-like isoleucine patch superfamily enzyme
VFEAMGRIEIGNYTLINPGARVTSAERITIGEGCMLAMHTSINDADWHDVQHRIFAPGSTAPVVLESNVWLGEGARVLKGVTIGENTVVGAGSVVSRSLPANVIAAGNPARVIKPLPEGEVSSRTNLFNMEVPYEQFANDFMRERLKGNNLLSWLGSFLFPRRFD